jgi:ribosomal protein S18 acetylase RimI-like enzyme
VKPTGPALRETLEPADVEAVRQLVTATRMFNAEEVEIAAELVEETLQRGKASGYEFLIASERGRLAGYSCFGRIAGTQSSFDLYWIAVDPGLQGRGLGQLLLARSEARVRESGGGRLYVETSGRAQYEPTRRFYARAGYRIEARLPDFYAPGDAKLIFAKALGARAESA